MKPAPQPSWRIPLAVGAALTILLHAPLVYEPLLWVAVAASFGVTGAVCGLLPAWLALRRDPEPRLGSGFAAGFIAVGIGALGLAGLTLVEGFTIGAEAEQVWREQLATQGMTGPAIDEFFARLRGGEGASWVVLSAAFVTFGGGFAGALVGAVRSRRQPPRVA